MTNKTITHIFARDADDRGAPSWALVRNEAGGIRTDVQIGKRFTDYEVRLLGDDGRDGKARLWRKADSLVAAWRLALELIAADQGRVVSANVEPLAGPHHFGVDREAGGRRIPAPNGDRGIRCIFPANI